MEKFYKKWDQVKTEYAEQCVKNNFTGTLNPELLSRVQETLIEILESFFLYGKYKDELKYFLSPMKGIQWGQYVSAKSQKMGCEFKFGIDYDGFFLTLDLKHAEHIKSMNDEFWCLLAELPKLGEFNWSENSGCSAESYKKLEKRFRKNNSNILKFACMYVFQELEDGIIDMGSLDLKWKPDIDWEMLLNKGIEAFRVLYKLSYLLYKCEYLAKRRSGNCFLCLDTFIYSKYLIANLAAGNISNKEK